MNDRIITTITIGAGPFDVTVDELYNQILVSVRDAGYIAMIDGATNTELLQKRAFLGGNPFAITLSQQPNRFYVVYDPYSQALSERFSAPELVPAEVNPHKLAVFELKDRDLGLIARIDVGNGGPNGGIGVAFNPSTRHLFVTNSADNTFTVLDALSLRTIATPPAVSDPGDVAINARTNAVYISNRGADMVQALLDNF
ncbi:MAG: hypothetical protein GXP38_09660 [Chloroflexi bacterium]|nr:hypothetical protein [Chloroflexota bacterium]